LFFFKPPSTSSTYTLSLHDALPISLVSLRRDFESADQISARNSSRPDDAQTLEINRSRTQALSHLGGESECLSVVRPARIARARSEEHTSELRSRRDLVCRLLLEKK